MTDLRATVIGLGARELTASPEGVRGTIHSIFRRVVNVRLESGRFLSFARPDVPPAPGTIIVDLAPPAGWAGLGLVPGGMVAGHSLEIQLSGGVGIALSGVTPYVPRIRQPLAACQETIPVRLERAAQRGAAYFHLAAERSPANFGGGFGPLLPHVLNLVQRDGRTERQPARLSAEESELTDPFCRAGYAALRGLVSAARTGDEGALTAQARNLLGLGPGLTPSGDDALAGLMVALALTGKALGFEERVLALLNPAMVRGLSGTTTELSADFLRYAALGWGNAVAEDVVELLLAGDQKSPPETDGRLDEAVERLCAIGASSGVDQLCGLLVGVGLGLMLAEERTSVWERQ
ncbi:MAG: DUF2877 domain-containing protein [Betaproteobacteria bacterium]